MMSRQRLIFALLAGLLVLAGSFGGGTAAAAAQGVPGTPTNGRAGEHCISQLVRTGAVAPKSGLPVMRPQRQCFVTQAEADAAATDLSSTSSSYYLSTVYEHAGGGGAGEDWYADTCALVVDLRGTFWDNRISSINVGCAGGASLYDGYEGGPTNYYGRGWHSYVGDYMNDRTSSIGYYPY